MRKPNILFLCSDEHQARAMGCAGHPFVQTPHLDALAARGTRFTEAITPSPICVPARASMATGLPVHRTRCWDNAMPYHGQIRSWGHALQEAGITVESIGKLHYRSLDDANGFDESHEAMMVLGGTGMLWASVRAENERLIAPDRMLGDKIGAGSSKYIDYDSRVTARATRWLEEHATDAEPWCLYVGLVAPHFPLISPPDTFALYPSTCHEPRKLHPSDGYRHHPWIARQDAVTATEAKFRDVDERSAAISAYFGLVTWLDRNVGQILGMLERLGLTDNTLVIYTSDHGDNLGARGLWGKSTFYAESVSVPMILAGPGVPVGTSQTPVSLLDIAPTITGHFGQPFELPFSARSLVDLAQEPDDPMRLVFSEYHATGAVSGGFMLRDGHWKYIHYVGFDPELFDLRADPDECHDLSGSALHQGVRQRMEEALHRTCDPIAVNRHAFDDQSALISAAGGRESAFGKGARGATPPPDR